MWILGLEGLTGEGRVREVEGRVVLQHDWELHILNFLTLSKLPGSGQFIPIVANINFLPTISIHCQKKWLWEINKMIAKRETALIFYLTLLTNS